MDDLFIINLNSANTYTNLLSCQSKELNTLVHVTGHSSMD